LKVVLNYYYIYYIGNESKFQAQNPLAARSAAEPEISERPIKNDKHIKTLSNPSDSFPWLVESMTDLIPLS
jgi:hypothetical protein